MTQSMRKMQILTSLAGMKLRQSLAASWRFHSASVWKIRVHLRSSLPAFHAIVPLHKLELETNPDAIEIVI